VRTRWVVLLGSAALGLGILGYVELVEDGRHTVTQAAAHICVAWTYVAAGLIGWVRRPQSRIGVLLVAAGFALLVRRLQYSDSSLVFTLAFAFAEVSNVLIAHAVLSYPTGRLRDRIEVVLVRIAYVLVVAFPAAALLFYDPSTTPDLFYQGFGGPPKSLLLVHGNDFVFNLIRDAYRYAIFGALGLAFVVLLVRRFVKSSPPMRHTLLPMAVAGAAAGMRALIEAGLTPFPDSASGLEQALFWWQIAAQVAIPIALLVGMLRAQLARGSVARLLLELKRTPPNEVRETLARTLGDPSLEVAFWVPEREGYIDASGVAVKLPKGGEERAVTRLDRGNEPVAALIHDRALLHEPELVEAAGAAAGLALENARLQAELRAQLAEVQASRARIVSAGDAERRRIEQDLHDGAQQRLVALALELRTTQRRLGATLDPELEAVLDTTVGQLQRAVEELRELAHGVHPPILTQGGLAAALEDLAQRVPIPVSVMEAPTERLAPDVEAAVYFVVCEALANVVKHAQASAATISLAHANGRLVVEIRDDGIGGADVSRGSGLRGLHDRVEARGGRLRVTSAPGEGTRIVGELPCAS
jgi:signal transduction histidine kinase